MEFIHLVGTESVKCAGQTINSASDNMIRAARTIDQAVYNFTRQIDRLEQLLEDVAFRIEKVVKREN